MKARIQQLAKEHFADIISFRRTIHENPELSFQEFKTTEFICNQLDQIGISYTRDFAETGVVATIKGNNPDKECIAIRADIDALPIVEQTDLPFSSKNEGKMHACGHDVHSACVFGATKILNDIRTEWEGTLKIIFQAGEELIPGGASILVNNGVLKNPEVSNILGQHVYTELPAGYVGFRPGIYMASTDEFHIEIKGTGGHAALTEYLKDPIVAMTHLLIGLRKTLQDNQPEDIPNVIGFGNVEAKGATNVIPDHVSVKGTFRTMNEEWRAKAHQLFHETSDKIAEEFGVTIDLGLNNGFPFLYNDPAFTNQSKESAKEYLGDEYVVDLPYRMTGEDFSYYCQEVPGCFYRLGVSNSFDDLSTGVHTSTFKVNESSLETGAGLMAWLVYNRLK